MWERIKEFVKWAWNVNVSDDCCDDETECLSDVPPHFTFIDGNNGLGKINCDRDIPGLTMSDTHYVCDYAKPQLCDILNEYYDALWFGDDE